MLPVTQSSWEAQREEAAWGWWLLERVCAGAEGAVWLCSQAAKTTSGPVMAVVIGEVAKMGCVHFGT